MDRLTTPQGSPAVSQSRYCDRLYDLLLAKAYRKHYSAAEESSEQADDYTLSLVAECNGQGVVCDIRLSD